jgi:acyl-CoA synthetase (AMP-forming)/AMP-acid ligase II/acyl carrier protein
MSPEAFLRRPYRWLRAISDHGGTLSVAPNFAYELCARRISPEQAKTLDLSGWTAALNGSERVRKDTMERFARAFEVSGFRRNAFLPCYGLAEATLMVSAGPRAATFMSIGVSREALSRNVLLRAEGADSHAEVMVGCGAVQLGQCIEIVNPDSGARAADDEVGEIWVSGPCVAQGYWKKPDETAGTFDAHIAGTGEGPFLRTGDLGFIHDGRLFVTGRIKDVIIVRGRNHYPEDVEHTAGESHGGSRPGGGAAFSVDGASEEHLVVLQEVKTEDVDTAAIAEAICTAVADRHRLRVDCVVLLRARTTPKTSSGKVRRHLCRQQFLEGTLDAIGEWRSKAMIDDGCGKLGNRDNGKKEAERPADPKAGLDCEGIEDWLVARFAELRGLPASEIDVRNGVATYGLDSAEAAMLAAELEERLGVELPPGVVWDYPTIEALAAAVVRFVADKGLNGESVGDAAALVCS